MSYHSDLDLVRKEARPWLANSWQHTYKGPSFQFEWDIVQMKVGYTLECGHPASQDEIGKATGTAHAWFKVGDPHIRYCDECKATP